MTLDELFAAPQYSLAPQLKAESLLGLMNQLTQHHRVRCPQYHRLLAVLHPNFQDAGDLDEIPFLPVSLFKSHSLLSVAQNDVFKVLTSSGTTGEAVSRIFLDRETARRQTLALSRILKHVLGPERMPMMLIENRATISDRGKLNARAAGVLGLMNFGRDHFFALGGGMELDEVGLLRFLSAHSKKPFLIFGFTFMVWSRLFLEIEKMGLDLSNGVLIHSGGWKKMQDLAVGNREFKARFLQAAGLKQIYNFYGMAEQVGSIFLEGADGLLYAPNFADVIIRDPKTLRAVPHGTPGLIQVLSALPSSYPGHSILTEDLGVVYPESERTAGRSGTAFSVLGRLPNAELRGCSDVFASGAAA